MAVTEIISGLLQITGNVADAIAVTDWMKRQRQVDRLEIYVNSYERALKDMAPHLSGLGDSNTLALDKELFKKQIRAKALLTQIEQIPPLAKELDAALIEPITHILCEAGVVTTEREGLSLQQARNLVSAAHQHYQQDIWAASGGAVIQSQIAALQDQMSAEFANAMAKLDALYAKDESVPPPTILIPDLPAWYQQLHLKLYRKGVTASGTITIDSLLTATDHKAAIVGAAGSGKTGLLQAAAYHLLTQNESSAKDLGVWVSLGSYAHDLVTTIKNAVGWRDIPGERVYPALEERGIVLLLDGLNEVPEAQRSQCAAEIAVLARSYKGSLLVSYPRAEHEFNDLGLPAYEVLPLTKDQIDDVIRQVFAAKGKESDVDWFIQRVTESTGGDKQAFYSLAQTPLYLRFILDIGLADGRPLVTPVDLYRQVIDVRLSSLDRRGHDGRIPIDAKAKCLAYLAYQSVIQDRGIRLPKSYVVDMFSKCVSLVDASIALDEVVSAGLLTGVDIFVEWTHPSFHDYFAGRELYTRIDLGVSTLGFPYASERSIEAIAFAVSMSTLPGVDLMRRPAVMNAVLDNDPSIDVLIHAYKAYRPSQTQGDCTDWECTKADVESLSWGERFVRGYRRISSVLERTGIAIPNAIPQPVGVSFFIDEHGQFCAVMFSHVSGTRFFRLEKLTPAILAIIKDGLSSIGFCLHSYLLPTIDPEVVAYIMVGLVSKWSGLAKLNTSNWFEDIGNYDYSPLAPWAYWDVLSSKLPTSSLGDVKWLQWKRIYSPVAFLAEPGNNTMPEQGMLGDQATDQKWLRMSLACLVRFDMDTLHMRPFDPILVQFPTPIFSFVYHVDAINTTMGFGKIHPVLLQLKKPVLYEPPT